MLLCLIALPLPALAETETLPELSARLEADPEFARLDEQEKKGARASLAYHREYILERAHILIEPIRFSVACGKQLSVRLVAKKKEAAESEAALLKAGVDMEKLKTVNLNSARRLPREQQAYVLLHDSIQRWEKGDFQKDELGKLTGEKAVLVASYDKVKARAYAEYGAKSSTMNQADLNDPAYLKFYADRYVVLADPSAVLHGGDSIETRIAMEWQNRNKPTPPLPVPSVKK